MLCDLTVITWYCPVGRNSDFVHECVAAKLQVRVFHTYTKVSTNQPNLNCALPISRKMTEAIKSH